MPNPHRISQFHRGPFIAFAVGSVCACLWLTSARAQSVAEVLEQFGMVGTWSPDCSKNPDTETGSRVIYATSSTGAAQYASFIRFPDGNTVKTKMEIEQATILDDRRIKTVIRPLTITFSTGAAAPSFFFRRQEIITEKAGLKMHVLSNHFLDDASIIVENGKARNGQLLPLIGKCDAGN